MPAFAAGESGAVLVGQVVGAGRDDLVMMIVKMTTKLTVVYTAFCSILFLVFAHDLVLAFKPDAETLTIGMRLMRISILFLVIDATNIVARASLRATGDVRYPAWVNVLTAWVMTPPLTWLLGLHFGLGAFGGSIGLCGEVIAGTAFQWLRLRNGNWKPHAERMRSTVLAIADA
jgi:Na+-driven multidrug efflux pump